MGTPVDRVSTRRALATPRVLGDPDPVRGDPRVSQRFRVYPSIFATSSTVDAILLAPRDLEVDPTVRLIPDPTCPSTTDSVPGSSHPTTPLVSDRAPTLGDFTSTRLPTRGRFCSSPHPAPTPGGPTASGKTPDFRPFIGSTINRRREHPGPISRTDWPISTNLDPSPEVVDQPSQTPTDVRGRSPTHPRVDGDPLVRPGLHH